MFSNEFYCGYFSWNDEDGIPKRTLGKHTPMISLETFDQAQKILKKKNITHVTNGAVEFAFKGAICCGECHGTISAEAKRQCICTNCKHKFSRINSDICNKCGAVISKMNNPTFVDKNYYRCTKKRGVCSQKYILDTEIEKQIKEFLETISLSKEFYDWAVGVLSEMHDIETSEQKNILKQLRKRETEQIKYLGELVKMKARGEITRDQFSLYNTEGEQELANLGIELAKLHSEIVDWNKIANKYFEFAHSVRDAFTHGDNETKKLILMSLGSNLTLKDKKLSIIWHLPFETIRQMNSVLILENTPLEHEKTPILQGVSSCFGSHFESVLPR